MLPEIQLRNKCLWAIIIWAGVLCSSGFSAVQADDGSALQNVLDESEVNPSNRNVQIPESDLSTPSLQSAELQSVPKNQKFTLDYGLEDKTGPESSVRVNQLKLGADYHMTGQQSIGIEATRGIQDSQDAKAWGKSSDDENAANLKYKLSF